jgi:hypothetical protein
VMGTLRFTHPTHAFSIVHVGADLVRD